ncbi:MAG: hypothetical protein M3P53_00270 [Actinomycetota bacterium]|nr:hypothetical protein [Actinomycetota bacterium]
MAARRPEDHAQPGDTGPDDGVTGQGLVDATPATAARPAPVLPPRPPDPPGLSDSDGSWMSPREAAEAAGVPQSTVRKWRKAGTIAERKQPGGGLQVFLTSDRRAADTAGVAPTPTQPTSELGVLVPLEVYQRSLAELILRLTDTTERAVRAEAEVEQLRQRLAELQRSP